MEIVAIKDPCAGKLYTVPLALKELTAVGTNMTIPKSDQPAHVVATLPGAFVNCKDMAAQGACSSALRGDCDPTVLDSKVDLTERLQHSLATLTQ